MFSDSLPLLHDEEWDVAEHELPPIHTRFFVPRLSDKPQDPIMDTLKVMHTGHVLPVPFSMPALPTELLALQDLYLPSGIPAQKQDTLSLFWNQASQRRLDPQSRIESWDTLRSSFPKAASQSPFLSEQSSIAFAAARYHVDPRLDDPTAQIIHVHLKELMSSIRKLLIGNASPLYDWDPTKERFFLANVPEGKRGILIVDGRDDVLTESFLQRFLKIGILLRRMELFIAKLRKRFANGGPTTHSFTHALSSCLGYLRTALTAFPSSGPTVDLLHSPSALWLQHAEFEDLITALASLCGCDTNLNPPDYREFSPHSGALLTAIYAQLELHIERGSPRMVNSMLAYVLTVTSDEYYQSLSQLVGYRQDLILASTRDPFTFELLDGAIFDDDGDVDEDDSKSADGGDGFPSFITLNIAETLVSAKKSLKLLRMAQPDHPLLSTQAPSHRKISWYWRSADVEAAWNGSQVSDATTDDTVPPYSRDKLPAQMVEDRNAILQQFKIFDLEPGAHGNPLSSSHGQDSSLQAFLDAFPDTLPALTPTLPHLTDLVLSPLIEHCSIVSSSLLSVVLSPSSYLNIHSHLVVLRSYMLLTSPTFTARLKAALFSDSDDWNFEGSSVRALAKQSHARTRTSSSSGKSGAPWAVGLGLGLSERDSWPPGGADLSYYLRTVIVDSLESADHPGREVKNGNATIIEDAEFRLGFALRDLPVGSGRERWLNPCSIEALDFLLMDYKPPRPLDVVITPDTLSKYQRVFSFIMRLMRVQSALSSLFRMTRRSSEPLFPTLSPSNQLLLHFRFIAHSFVEILSEYVFDTAIRGNFDTFLAYLTPDSDSRPFSNIFALSELHSSVLDDVLSACLLRSGQRSAGDLLRGGLELALDLCILSGELKRGRLEEYQAAPVLQDLHTAFRGKMASLVKALRAMVDTGSSASHLPLESAYLAKMGPGIAPGGMDSLRRLLVMLDVGDWWIKGPS